MHPAHRRPTRALALTGLAAIAGATLLALAAQPHQEVFANGRTLDEIEPRTPVNLVSTPGDANSVYRITEPGSYYLTGNIEGGPGLNGVEIAASGVTLDLNGFDLFGGKGSLSAVVTDGTRDDVRIFNGTVRLWGGHGVAVGSGRNARLSDIRAHGNGGFGIVSGDNAIVSDCTASDNGSHGLSLGVNCVARDCASYANLGGGIQASQNGAIERCSIRANSLFGVNTGNGCVITDCSIRANGSSGVAVVSACTVTGCSISANGADGIVTAGDCRIADNVVDSHASGAGIRLTGTGNRLEAVASTGNAVGFAVERGANLIIANSASKNGVAYQIAPNNALGPIIPRSAMQTDFNPAANFEF